MTLDRVYRWRLLLEEYGPEIVYIKGKHKTIADTVSQLEYDPSVNQTAENYHLTKVRSFKSRQRQNWMTVSKHWCNVEIDTHKPEDLNFAFANHQELKVYNKRNARMPKKDMCLQLLEDTKVLCK